MIQKNKQKPSKEEVVEYLKAMRLEFLIEVEKGRDPEEISKEMTKRCVIRGSKETAMASLKLVKAANMLNAASAGSFAWRSMGAL